MRTSAVSAPPSFDDDNNERFRASRNGARAIAMDNQRHDGANFRKSVWEFGSDDGWANRE